MNDTAARQMKIVELTEKAGSEILRLLREDGRQDLGLRLSVKGGGCSGLSYDISFDLRRETDFVDRQHGIDLFVDPKSGLYLKDVTLDFQGGISGRGFTWINPNATNTCGCGESFSV